MECRGHDLQCARSVSAVWLRGVERVDDRTEEIVEPTTLVDIQRVCDERFSFVDLRQCPGKPTDALDDPLDLEVEPRDLGDLANVRMCLATLLVAAASRLSGKQFAPVEPAPVHTASVLCCD